MSSGSTNPAGPQLFVDSNNPIMPASLASPGPATFCEPTLLPSSYRRPPLDPLMTPTPQRNFNVPTNLTPFSPEKSRLVPQDPFIADNYYGVPLWPGRNMVSTSTLL